MKHRQRPKINGVLGNVGGENVALRQKRSSAMVIDNSLGVPGGAGGVVQRDGIPFIIGPSPRVVRIAGLNHVFVVHRANASTLNFIFRINIVHDKWFHFAQFKRCFRKP